MINLILFCTHFSNIFLAGESGQGRVLQLLLQLEQRPLGGDDPDPAAAGGAHDERHGACALRPLAPRPQPLGSSAPFQAETEQTSGPTTAAAILHVTVPELCYTATASSTTATASSATATAVQKVLQLWHLRPAELPAPPPAPQLWQLQSRGPVSAVPQLREAGWRSVPGPGQVTCDSSTATTSQPTTTATTASEPTTTLAAACSVPAAAGDQSEVT